ncbi:conserved protein of unknown function [Tenacibaculum sp. 190130A14a]|uniref:Uncharacterized protein n=1 Tax=Tenacibaculum polynesiense TaxID=3137857 RepID=A0ABP1F416_9FLAO
MRKFKSNVVNVTIEQSQPSGSQTLKIDSGIVTKCVLLTNDVPAEFINVKIEDVHGDELHPSVSYKEYQPTNGNHFESRKDIYFEGNRDIKVTAYADGAVSKAFKFQMLFYVEPLQD